MSSQPPEDLTEPDAAAAIATTIESDEEYDTDDSRDPDETFSQSSMETNYEDVMVYDLVWDDESGTNFDTPSTVRFKANLLSYPFAHEKEWFDEKTPRSSGCKVYFSCGEMMKAKYQCKLSYDQKTFSEFEYLWMNDDMYRSMPSNPLSFRFDDRLDPDGYPFFCWYKRRLMDAENDFEVSDTPATISGDEMVRLDLETIPALTERGGKDQMVY